MLKRKFRFSPRGQKAYPLSIPSNFLTVKIAKNNLEHNRFAFVVSKKVHVKAVHRNKVKRRLSRCLEKIFSDIQSGYDMIFIARPHIVSLSQDILCVNIKTLLFQKKLLQ